MSSEIAENIKYKFISIRHRGIIKNGVEDTESPEVKAWTPAFENYTFSEKDDLTEIKIEIDIPDDYVKYFDETWPKALHRLKQICED
jgi:hypothetical protein